MSVPHLTNFDGAVLGFEVVCASADRASTLDANMNYGFHKLVAAFNAGAEKINFTRG
ncbi:MULTISPECIES: hypothetical protein [Pseudomonas]|uniref:hypothetical protein n=1 Tax=Pseudomonas TaxID=286 RepID=UPI001304B3A7|nr:MULTISPECIES: hypothetical protein [Pseudomonas]